jgi:hypothetical protein
MSLNRRKSTLKFLWRNRIGTYCQTVNRSPGGNISAKSKVGEGSKFSLPCLLENEYESDRKCRNTKLIQNIKTCGISSRRCSIKSPLIKIICHDFGFDPKWQKTKNWNRKLQTNTYDIIDGPQTKWTVLKRRNTSMQNNEIKKSNNCPNGRCYDSGYF